MVVVVIFEEVIVVVVVSTVGEVLVPMVVVCMVVTVVIMVVVEVDIVTWVGCGCGDTGYEPQYTQGRGDGVDDTNPRLDEVSSFDYFFGSPGYPAPMSIGSVAGHDHDYDHISFQFEFMSLISSEGCTDSYFPHPHLPLSSLSIMFTMPVLGQLQQYCNTKFMYIRCIPPQPFYTC